MDNNTKRISGTMRMIYSAMKAIILYDFVFKRWLLDDEYTLDWLTNRVLNCYFFDDVFCYDERITLQQFRGRYGKRLRKYIEERRTAERRKAEVAA